MRTLSYLLTVVFVLAGPFPGPAEADLPGVGTFSYNGPAVAAPSRVIAALN